MKVRLSAECETDLLAAVEFALGRSSAFAEGLVNAFETAITNLASFPELGVRRGDRRTLLIASHWLLVYRVVDGVVVILRVVPASRDF